MTWISGCTGENATCNDTRIGEMSRTALHSDSVSRMAHEIEIVSRGVLIAEGCVLLCRNKKHGHSYLPGGHVDPFETASHALAREMIEEAALSIRVGGLLLASENSFVQNGKPRHEINLVFHVEHPHSHAGTSHAATPGEDSSSVTREHDACGTDSAPSPVVPDHRHTAASAEPGQASAWAGSGKTKSDGGSMFHVEPQEAHIEFWWCPLSDLAKAGFVPESLRHWLESGPKDGPTWLSAMETPHPA